MNLEQFKFKKSKRLGFEEEAKQPIGKNSFVEIFKDRQQFTVVKTLNGRAVSNVLVTSIDDLETYLSKMSKKRGNKNKKK